MKILAEKPSAFKMFMQDFVIPIAPFVIVAVIGLITNHFLAWIAEILP